MVKSRFDSVNPPLSELPYREMDKYVSAAVPFNTAPDGRRYLTDLQLAQEPHLAAFVSRFKSSFERDQSACIWWFTPLP